MAEALFEQKRYSEARTWLQEAVGLADDNPGCQLLMAIVSAHLGQDSAAALALARFGELTPLAPTAFLDQ